MQKVLLSVFLASSIVLSSQTLMFQKKYGNPQEDAHASSIVNLPGGGYMLTGIQATQGGLSSAAFVVQLNANGDTVWTRTYSGASGYTNAYGTAIAGSGYVIFGGTSSFGNGGSDLFTLTLDANGDTVRTFTYGGSGDDDCLNGNGSGVETEGNYVFCGQTRSYGAGLYDTYIIKTDFTGNVLWSRAYGGPYSEQGGAIVQTLDSGFACTGYTTSYGSGGTDIYLFKTDSTGNLLWSRCYGLATNEFGFGLIQTSDQGYLISGMRQISPTDYEAVLLKTDFMGNLMWTKQYGTSSGNEWASAAVEVSGGGFIFCGRTGSFGNGAEDMLLVRTNMNGDTLWTKAFGYMANDYAYSVIETPDGGFIVAGGGPGPAGARDQVYVVKTDGFGFSGCNETYAPVNVTPANFLQATVNMSQASGCSSTVPAWQANSGTVQQNFCSGVGVEELNGRIQPLIYPSPATHVVTVVAPASISAHSGKVCVILNVAGQEVYRTSTDASELQLDVSEFSPGLYLCRFEMVDGIVSVGKFVVE